MWCKNKSYSILKLPCFKFHIRPLPLGLILFIAILCWKGLMLPLVPAAPLKLAAQLICMGFPCCFFPSLFKTDTASQPLGFLKSFPLKNRGGMEPVLRRLKCQQATSHAWSWRLTE